MHEASMNANGDEEDAAIAKPKKKKKKRQITLEPATDTGEQASAGVQ